MAYTYSDYTRADSILPIVVGVFLTLLGLLSWIGFLIYVIYKRHQREKVEVPYLMYAGVSAIFKDAIKRKTVANETVYVIMDRKISQIFIPALSFLIPSFMSCFFVSFWEVFLIDNSYTCDPDLDCFPFDANNNTNLQDDPIANCTDFDISDNITIICYHFAFNFTDAAGLVGGLLSLIAFVFMLLVSVLYWSLGLAGEDETAKKKCKYICCWWLKRITLFILAISPTVGSIIAVVLVYKVPAIHDALTERKNFWKFYAYFLTFMYLGFVFTLLVRALYKSVPYKKPVTLNENSPLINTRNSEETSTAQNSSEHHTLKNIPDTVPAYK